MNHIWLMGLCPDVSGLRVTFCHFIFQKLQQPDTRGSERGKIKVIGKDTKKCSKREVKRELMGMRKKPE